MQEYQYTALEVRADWYSPGGPYSVPVALGTDVTRLVASRFISGDKSIVNITTLDQVYVEKCHSLCSCNQPLGTFCFLERIECWIVEIGKGEVERHKGNYSKLSREPTKLECKIIYQQLTGLNHGNRTIAHGLKPGNVNISLKLQSNTLEPTPLSVCNRKV